MMKILKSVLAVVLAAAAMVSCNKEDLTTNTSANVEVDGRTLVATFGNFSSEESKVLHTTNATYSANLTVSLSWEDGDSFTVYDGDNNYFATYTLVGDAEDGVFTTSESATLVDGVTYTAVYPATTSTENPTLPEVSSNHAICEVQKKVTAEHLRAVSHMRASFTYSSSVSGISIAFQNQKALLCVDMSAVKNSTSYVINPLAMSVIDGDNHFDIMIPYGQSIGTVVRYGYFLVDANDTADERDLKVRAYTNTPSAIEFTKTITQPFVAGGSYYLKLTDDDITTNEASGTALSTLCYTNGGVNDISAINFDGKKAGLVVFYTGGGGLATSTNTTLCSYISNVLGGLDGTGAAADGSVGLLLLGTQHTFGTTFNDAKALRQFYTPELNSAISNAFDNCVNLESFISVKAKGQGADYFKGCTSFKEFFMLMPYAMAAYSDPDAFADNMVNGVIDFDLYVNKVHETSTTANYLHTISDNCWTYDIWESGSEAFTDPAATVTYGPFRSAEFY